MKKNKFILDDVEDDALDIAYLLFHAPQPGYIFADNLNRLYNFALHRIDDILDNYPFYTHSNPITHKHYFLIEKPALAQPSGSWHPSDKLLLIKGEGAPLEAQAIFDDFTTPKPPAADDLLELQHAELRDQMLEDFTVVNLLDFSAPTPTNPRAARDRAALELHCNQILNHIENKHLDLPESERQHLRRGE